MVEKSILKYSPACLTRWDKESRFMHSELGSKLLKLSKRESFSHVGDYECEPPGVVSEEPFHGQMCLSVQRRSYYERIAISG